MSKKIAIVYDWMDKWGGVERVLLALHTLFPQAPFYTSYYDKKGAQWAAELDIHTSFIQKLPTFIKSSRIFSVPLYPYAFENFDFSAYDTVISVTSSFAKGIITKPDTNHICYLLTPTRFIWGQSDSYKGNGFISFNKMLFGKSVRDWDYIAAQHPDKIISISQLVAERCQKYYNRASQVLYPPFDIHYWTNITAQSRHLPESFYLVVSRLEKYKNVETVVQAFNKSGKSLVIIGKGTEKSDLQRKAGKNTVFLQDLSDGQLAYIYSKASALIMPQEEDFGYVSLEAQSLGCPVLTYGKSGAAETILEGKTGVTYLDSSIDGLRKALERYDKISYNLKSNIGIYSHEHLEKFEKKYFEKALKNAVYEK